MTLIGRRGAMALGAAGLALAPAPLRAQAVPRNVRMLVGFAPGGPTDLVARLYAERLRPAYAPAALVENRPGATGRLALEAVRTSEPDGATMLMSPASVMTLQPHIFPREARHDALTDFVPVCTLWEFAFALAVPASHPARSFAELITWLRNQTGPDVVFGSPGAGSGGHFVGDMVGRAVGVSMNHVPYRGMPPAVTDLVAGHIPVLITTMPSAAGVVREGRVRLLAYTAPGAPDGASPAPPVKEAGIDYESDIWWGLFAPRGLPAEILTRLNAEANAALADPEMAKLLQSEGARPSPATPQAFTEILRVELMRWRDVAAAANIKLD